MSLLLVAGLSFSSHGDELSAHKLIEQLSRLQEFSASFTQTIYGSAIEVLQVSDGDIAIVRPLKFRWHLSTPYEQLIVTAGKVLYIYDPDLEQVQLRDTREALSGTPALLLAGDPKEVADLFDILLLDTLPETLENQAEGDVVYSLRPKQQDSLFSDIRFFFHNDMPISIEIRDALGHLTRVDFFDLKLNAGIPEKTFLFEIPNGVDVIGDAKVTAS
ncbi:MAG: outer membrane lipoprotein chaperone LolA [Pseudomonadales bacterium]|nr:outer membrane lipoprotein chaperone LolA [Pseudomonadales bacterium]